MMHDESIRHTAQKLRRAFSVVEFFSIAEGLGPRPRAILLEMATPGACRGFTARPRDEWEVTGVGGRFVSQVDFVAAHQAALSLPLSSLGHMLTGCSGCGQHDAWAGGAGHLASCRGGFAGEGNFFHNPVRDALAEMLMSAYPRARVLVEPASWPRFSAVKRPDIVVECGYGPGIHLLIDVKTVDGAGATHLRVDHTDRFPLGAHNELENGLIREYTYRGGVHYPHAIGNNKLVCCAVGRWGGLGKGLRQLIKDVAILRGGRVEAARRTHLSDTLNFEPYWTHRLSTAALALTAERVRGLYADDESGEAGSDAPEESSAAEEDGESEVEVASAEEEGS